MTAAVTIAVPDVPVWELPVPLPGITPTLPEEVRRFYTAVTAAAAELSVLVTALLGLIEAADDQLGRWCREVTGDDDEAFELLCRFQDAGGSGAALELLLHV